MSDSRKLKPNSRPIHAGPDPDPVNGAVSTPIYQTSTFSFDSTDQGANRFAGTEQGYIYTRLGNPTIRALEQAVAELEDGYDGLATATGMAAISTTFLSLLKTGDHMIGTDSVYGPTRILMESHLDKFGITSDWVSTDDLDNIRKAIRPNTKMIYIETPANPTIKITDLEGAGRIAHENGAFFVVDNTFSSPLLQKPFEYGADVVLHSMTKYLNGHTDVVAGMIVAREQDLYARLKKSLLILGGTMDPHQAWLVLRGLRTLAMRVNTAQTNAERLATWLQAHPAIQWISYPGLPSHPGHELMKKQMKGPGSMISFGVKGDLETAKVVINSMKLATLAVSLGGIETLIEHPASMTHAGMPREEREEAGITDDLIRLAVGCEDFDDLKDDLEQAMAKVNIEVEVG
ncbi:MAG: PLP-dependent transferase [Acidobacteria bacterium]|uniref:L-methionine gamma-lyase n=1 Tax=Candidatus Polarisedimenticola svalbardensis TaxID=2886004 RepID=A0A8J6XY07_9BACT|nr:PLP-dependent transferase [Candidatus Polarisedimenticola svalbardensis]